jgi:DNA mismatch endonuclease (patch repair protein)
LTARRLTNPPPTSEGVRASMRANRARDTGPEIRLRSALRRAGLTGYRVAPKGLPGRPDIAFTKHKLALFVHGCYWHRCPHCTPRLPRSHAAFWRVKFEQNVVRDERKRRELDLAGWEVLEIWECEIGARIDDCVARVRRALATAQDSR